MATKVCCTRAPGFIPSTSEQASSRILHHAYDSFPTILNYISQHASAQSGLGSVCVECSAVNNMVKKRQQEVKGFLEANRISFEEIDITMLEDQRLWMYKNIPENKQPEKGHPLLPQIFNETVYCGDYEDFFLSKEANTVFSFLGLNSQALGKDAESETV